MTWSRVQFRTCKASGQTGPKTPLQLCAAGRTFDHRTFTRASKTTLQRLGRVADDLYAANRAACPGCSDVLGIADTASRLIQCDKPPLPSSREMLRNASHPTSRAFVSRVRPRPLDSVRSATGLRSRWQGSRTRTVRTGERCAMKRTGGPSRSPDRWRTGRRRVRRLDGHSRERAARRNRGGRGRHGGKRRLVAILLFEGPRPEDWPIEDAVH